MRIAIVGKGGNGKSTVAGTVARLIGRVPRPVLAMDVDTLPGLSFSLGMGRVENATLPTTLAERRENEGWVMKDSPDPHELVVQYAQAGPDNVRFLQIGKFPAAIPQASTTAFRHVLQTFDDPKWSVVIDLAAGVRQAAYGWALCASFIGIVVEPTQASVLTARRLRTLINNRPDVHIGLILNKLSSEHEETELKESLALPIWAALPHSREVAHAEQEGVALLDLAPHSDVVTRLQTMITQLQVHESIRSSP
ncbi:MAG: hypothetical protein M3160_07270 [Candidatus Eremiobacteraeota bacterium]|nr:hypothetical protein [Candidatus Eremiobacteraeota bacterium]